VSALEPLETRAVDTRWRRVFGAPIVIGVLSLCGLMAAMLSAGLGRYLAWVGVGSPLVMILWCCVRQFRESHATGGS
jgi:hypothetical protein